MEYFPFSSLTFSNVKWYSMGIKFLLTGGKEKEKET